MTWCHFDIQDIIKIQNKQKGMRKSIQKGGESMPTDTFMKLPQEKKEKIIIAAKKEFARVPIAEVSIKNIVSEAEIARGSFYQYFESKQDLLIYMMQNQVNIVKNKMEEALRKNKGDIFETFIMIYDYMVEQCVNKQDGQFYKKIFENIKAGEETLFIPKPPEESTEKFYNVYQLVDTSKLKLHKAEDLQLIIKMLHAITRAALAYNAKTQDKEKARNDYIKQLQYLKEGTQKKSQQEDKEKHEEKGI